MKLVDAYRVESAEKILFDLLKERDPRANISHRQMPTFEQHCAFIASHPYRELYLIISDTSKIVGACYLSKQNEIGVFVFQAHQGKGYAQFAVQALILRHPDEHLLANIAPENTSSHALFQSLGFRLIQYTYEWTPSDENSNKSTH